MTSEREGVRGLVDYDAGLLNDFGGGDVNWWQDYLRAEIERANEFWREQTEQALAAEGVQAGEVEQRAWNDEAAWALAASAEAAGAERDSDDDGTWWTLRIEHFNALSHQPEARGVVRHDLCDCPNGRAEHSPSCAALTEARNVR